jgi:hypothetical protein
MDDDVGFWLEAMDQYVNSPEYSAALRSFCDSQCECFVDVKSGEFGLAQNDVFQVRGHPLTYLSRLFHRVNDGITPKTTIYFQTLRQVFLVFHDLRAKCCVTGVRRTERAPTGSQAA